MKLVWSIGLLAGVLLLGTASESFAQKYTVYCTKGKTEVDTRTPEQMKSARGGSTYPMATFDYKLDADKFVKKMNGVCPKK